MSIEPLTGKNFGSYELKEMLGRGGMAQVYRGYQAAIDRSVAVKVLPAELLSDPSFSTRFFNEARTLAKLTHPSILPLYDFGEANRMPYIVMPLMSNGTLAERLKQGPLTLPDTVRIITAVAQALDYASKQGILHRDVKPNNILFDQHDNPYLADFGIAKVLESNTSLTGTGIIGTPDYMSPEQARGDPLDHRSDLYSLAVVTYQCLTGQQLFSATTPMGLIFKHVSETPRPLREARPDIPEAVEKVVLKALAKDPKDRYPSAIEFARALASAAASAATEQAAGTVISEAAPTEDITHQRSEVLGGTQPEAVATGSAWGTLPPTTMSPPAVKKSNTGLWIGLGVGALVLACGACIALGFGGAMLSALTSTPTPEPVVLFQDNFSDVDSGWGTNSDDVSEKVYEGDEFVVRVKQDGWLSWSTAGLDLQDIRIDTVIRSTGHVETGFGVFCYYQDEDNFYMGGITGDGYYAIIRRLDGAYTVLNDVTNNEWQQTDLITVDAESYRLTFECARGDLTLWVDGVQLVKVQDETFTSGDIGLFAQAWDNPPAEAHFDDLVVTEVP